MATTQPRNATALREFFTGVSFLFRGFRIWITAPRLMFLGMIPAAIVGTMAIALVVALIVNVTPVTEFITPFANEWDELPRVAVRFAAGVALVLASILIILNTFTTITLMVGDAFYRTIAGHVDAQYGAPAPHPSKGFWSDARRGVAEGLRLLLPTVGVALLVFAVGFIPVVGSVVAAISGAIFGGWLLVTELANIPCEVRGMHLSARRAMLKTARARSLGLGAATYLVFLLPFGAVFAMPAALAGATLLTRSLLDENLVRGAATPHAQAPAPNADQPPEA